MIRRGRGLARRRECRTDDDRANHDPGRTGHHRQRRTEGAAFEHARDNIASSDGRHLLVSQEPRDAQPCVVISVRIDEIHARGVVHKDDGVRIDPPPQDSDTHRLEKDDG